MTQEAKHTPGPWRTDEHGNIVCYPEGLSVGVLSRQLPEGELKANHQPTRRPPTGRSGNRG
jgi:hypothetical protein